MKILYLCLISYIFLVGNLSASYYFSIFDNPKYSKDFESFDYIEPNAPQGGELRIGAVGSFNNLNPFILQGNPGDGIGFSFDSLMSKSKDELAPAYPLIAKSINISPTNSEVSFNLNQNVRFHDGSYLTAKDIKFTFETLSSKGHPRYKVGLRDILSIKIIDQYNVTFSLKDIKNKDLILTIIQMPILSKKYFEENDFTKTTLKPIMGSGPYTISGSLPGKSITYTKNLSYWGKDLPVNTGLYNFSKITYIYYRDSNIAIRGLKANEYDFRYENIAKNWATQYKDPKIKLHLKQEMVQHSIPSSMQCFSMNNRLAKFSNLNVRKAINLAFDFEWTNKNLFFGSYNRTRSFFDNSVFKALPQITNSEMQILSEFNYSQTEINNLSDIIIPTNNGNGYNRESLIKAKLLLEEAGYHINNHKLIDPNTNQPFTIEFLITSSSFKRVILPYIASLKKLGISSNIKLVDSSIYQKRLESFEFDITVSVFPISMIPGNELYAYLHSNNKDINGSRNIAGIDNPRIDEIVKIIPNITELEELKSYTSILDRLLLSNYYIIPHWNISAFRLVYWDNITHPETTPAYDLCLECWHKS
ncbi:MAG: ABC transporter substrate-binding protein [Rickettsiales bacterium]|nr:ABC transporter substrate-binding protein [Rickettsiales bacterium]